jgi:hypothetical protein
VPHLVRVDEEKRAAADLELDRALGAGRSRVEETEPVAEEGGRVAHERIAPDECGAHRIAACRPSRRARARSTMSR